MNVLKYIFISLILVPTIMLVFLQYISFNQNWYRAEFDQLKIIENPILVDNLFLYLNEQEELEKTFYTEREILHLLDIKSLVKVEKFITVILASITFLILLLILIMQKFKEFIRTIFFANTLALIIYIILSLIIYLNFEFIFIKFHQVAFNNGYWMLNPTDSLIITFPPQLFADLIKEIFALSVLLHTILFFTAGITLVGIMLKKIRKA